MEFQVISTLPQNVNDRANFILNLSPYSFDLISSSLLDD